MNQILITGDEQITERIFEKKVNKPKSVLPINGIVVFYAVCIIILGICIISGSLYAKNKINEEVEASIKPEIKVERNEEDDTIEITVTHIREIASVTYTWNDEAKTTIDGENRKSITETIELIGGENILKVVVTEENGQTSILEKKFIVANIPEIELQAVANGVKVIVTSKEKIEYVQYSWDNGEMQKIEVGDEKYEGIINAPKGKHTLKIEVVDTKGTSEIKEQVVVGDTEPTVNLKLKRINGMPAFIIDVEDDENIKTVEITHNGGETKVIEVNDKKYHNEVIMTEGEINTIEVTAINQNNLSKTRKGKYEN